MYATHELKMLRATCGSASHDGECNRWLSSKSREAASGRLLLPKGGAFRYPHFATAQAEAEVNILLCVSSNQRHTNHRNLFFLFFFFLCTSIQLQRMLNSVAARCGQIHTKGFLNLRVP